MKKNHKDRSDYKKKDLDYIICPIHRVRYLRGTECPQCRAERNKQNK